MFLLFFLSQDKLSVSAVNRVVEETISIGMPIPRRKVKGGGGGINTLCEIIRADKQEEAGRILPKIKNKK